ncbi:MAG TPA: PUA domain-containing protein [Candidatus Acidoferrales bacterium]|nr:PUA domain-containing protein [Candidatus Acidoferrales bacterium]
MTTLRRLKDKEARTIVREFVAHFPNSEATLRSSKVFDELLVGDGAVIVADGKPLILRTKRGVFPSLKFDVLIQSLPHVVVDMGAVAHIANGAHLMRPGIRNLSDDFGKGDLLVVVDEKYGKPIALGFADMDSVSMRLVTKGKVIDNFHYVGDDVWKSFSSIG